MSIKQTPLLLVILGLSSCLPGKAQNETSMMQTNSHWHIISGSFSNEPSWLVPSNVPVAVYPLNNGQWVWSTNFEPVEPFDQHIISIGIDAVKEHQMLKQQKNRWDEINPPGVANVLEYRGRWWDTNGMPEMWWGVWSENTNTSWRVNLRIYPTNANAAKMEMTVHVGSVITNSGAGLLPSPDGKYAKLELLDAKGRMLPTRPGAALKLYYEQYGVLEARTVHNEILLLNVNPPSGSDATVERTYPDTISDLEYPRSNVDFPLSNKGGFFKYAGFASNGPPCHIGFIRFNDIFSIKVEGDYTLTVQPVLFRMHYDGGTFQGYLDRADLPSVTTKVHLKPIP